MVGKPVLCVFVFSACYFTRSFCKCLLFCRCREAYEARKKLAIKNRTYVFSSGVRRLADSERGITLFVGVIVGLLFGRIRRWENSELIIRVYLVLILSKGFLCFEM